ncbi:ABC transporter substrate-binding protein [Paenibacillus sabinae]|uniref:Fe3+ ABC transporter periplasmic protein n=1 Tax=Paenibacillus sabinae T27 TaxID=1268072 RepID=X4ZKL6_9BACL|nr:ABC transporter substrate-binding protein [Paenibacillus sabinae]AHV97250.1 Fe3+ ABC transporter periplasmic protein [Paenibacillus sabinae T27]
MGAIRTYLKLGELLAQYPDKEGVLKDFFDAGSSEELLRRYGADAYLNRMLGSEGKPADTLLSLLNEGEDDRALPPSGELDFLGMTICLMRQRFQACFDEWMTDYREETGLSFNCYLPRNCGSGNPYRNVWQAENVRDFPGIVSGCGFSDFFRAEFRDNLLNKNVFQAVDMPINASLSSDLIDPYGAYTLYGIYPYVMMIDETRIGSLPRPREWADLMNPVYEDNVIVIGSPEKVSELLLMYTHKEHGDEGIRRLGVTIKDGWHGSRMAKTAGSGSSEGAAIYVLPWAFARFSPRPDKVSVVWPEDGAIANPLFMLVRKDRYQELEPIARYMTGPRLGREVAACSFPALSAEVDNALPAQAKMKWLGWDYLRSVDLQQLKNHTQSLFQQNWKRKSLAGIFK